MIGPPPTGWRDAHLHLAAHGESLEAVDLAGCASADEALERIAQRAEAEADHASPGDWITAVRARAETWPGQRWPAHDQIHDAARGRPAIIRNLDIHSGAASTRVLELAGIDASTPDPPGGRIDRDEHGAPTGLLIEKAWRLIDAHLPTLTDDQLVRRVKLAAADLAARGFTEAHDMWTDLPLARAGRALERAGELPLRVGLAPLYAQMTKCLADPSFQSSSQVWTVGIKIFTDGALNSRTAHMLEPYADPDPAHPRGAAIMMTDEITRAVRDADTAGLPIIPHAIGDAAVRSVLDAIERAAPSVPGQRLEHAQFVDEADVPRFAALGVIASMQPCHLLTDIEPITRLLPHRAHRAFPVRDLVDSAKAVGKDPADLIWFGSDAPVVPPSVEDNLQAAVQRKRKDTAPVAPAQAITETEAIAFSSAPSPSGRASG